MKYVRNNYSKAAVVLFGFVVAFGFQLRTGNTRLSGDDFLLVNYWGRLPIDAKSVWDLFWLTGQDKWRPVSTIPLVLLSRHLGFNNHYFLLINLVLLSILASIVGCYTYSLSKRFSVAIVSTAAVALTPFNWYVQTSLFGLMEVLNVLLCLIALILICKNYEKETRLRFALAYSFLLASSLCHERFIIVAISSWAYSLLFRRNKDNNRFSIFLLTIPLLHIFFKGFLLQIDPLTGGGESNLRSSFGPWIVEHFKDSLGALFGMKSGLGIYYSEGTFQTKVSASHFGLFGLLVFLPAIVSLVYLFLRRADRTRSPRITSTSLLLMKSGLFFVTALALLIPAATVFERNEGRWLFASQVFLLIAFVGTVMSLWNEHSTSKTIISCIALCFSLAIVLTGLMYRGHTKTYLAIQSQPTLALEKLESEVPLSGDWGLLVNQVDVSMPTAWQFGYGTVFSQLPNPPSFVQFGSSWDLCPHSPRMYTCFQIELNGLDVSSKILTRSISAKTNKP